MLQGISSPVFHPYTQYNFFLRLFQLVNFLHLIVSSQSHQRNKASADLLCITIIAIYLGKKLFFFFFLFKHF